MSGQLALDLRQPSMTSVEIADLVEKRHDNVLRTIDTLVKKQSIHEPQIEFRERINGLGLAQKDKTYRFTGDQGKRDSTIVVAQLSPEFTARLVDRWLELEEQAKQAAKAQLPDFTNPAEAARAWASEYEAKQIAQQKVIELQPKADFHDRVTQSQDLLTIRETAKLLRTGERRLFGFLKREGLLMASNLPYQTFMDRGLFRLVETVWTDQFGRERISVKTCVTQKGLAYIQGLQDRLAMYTETAPRNPA